MRMIHATLGLMILITFGGTAYAEEFKLSYSCINCHQDRYNEWERSMHSLAIRDPVFETAYLKAIQSNPEYRQYCLGCHSPTTAVTKDYGLTKSISIEGVTCSFCHSVSGIENNTYIFNQSNPMFGPYSNSITDAHASAYSVLLTKSEFCAGCHEFSLNGIPISETFSEWKAGPYSREGKQCQDCHMETKTGVAAKNGPVRDKVYQHFWYGGHSGQFLEKAFGLESNVEKKGNRVKVTLNITNDNVGHKVPSGLPSRKVVLSFRANDETGKEIFSDQRVYAKTLVDQYGNEVLDFWKATAVSKDNRIGPRESRTEVFEFDAPGDIKELVTSATLTYQLEAEILTSTEETMNVEIARSLSTTKLEAFVPEAAATPKETPAPGWVAGFIAVMAAVLLSRMRRQ